jgi:peptidoglycan/xylan/chitin deacetylase (PgdA/CDA1 family)
MTAARHTVTSPLVPRAASGGVVLSGDIHHAIRAGDQTRTDRSESELALEYVSIAERHGLKTTLFVTGTCAIEAESEIRKLASARSVEIGGHGWDAFQPAWRYRFVNRAWGSPHGSATAQRRMVKRTCQTIARVARRPIRSWRNHAYLHDCNTAAALAAADVCVWSDVLAGDCFFPYRHAAGPVVLPINTTPDHEHVFHGPLTAEAVDERQGSYLSIDEWYERVSLEVARITAAGGIATILAHPICMAVADGFATFERLCQFLESFPTLWALESVGHARGGAPLLEDRTALSATRLA